MWASDGVHSGAGGKAKRVVVPQLGSATIKGLTLRDDHWLLLGGQPWFGYR